MILLHVTVLFRSRTLQGGGGEESSFVALSDFLGLAKSLKGWSFKTLNNTKRKQHAYPKSGIYVENSGCIVFTVG